MTTMTSVILLVIAAFFTGLAGGILFAIAVVKDRP